MQNFEHLLSQFADAVAAADGARLATLFTPDGVYDDGFFGPHRGPEAIAQMIDHFHEGGTQYRWEWFDTLADDHRGYARYRFSYVSKQPESRGKLVAFEGVGHFRFERGLIAHYGEVFDRALAFVQLGFEPERIRRIMGRYAETFRQQPEVVPHLMRDLP